jgi:hypothetical protein
VSPFPFEDVTATTPKAIVAQAEVATEVAGQAAAQYTQLMAEKAQLEQRAFIAEDRLNAALAEQTPMGTADAQTFDAERQALLAQIAVNEAAAVQAVATAEAAQQSIDAAAQSMADAAERERVLLDAQTNAEADRVARELEIARQNQATSELGTTPPAAPGSGTPSTGNGNYATISTVDVFGDKLTNTQLGRWSNFVSDIKYRFTGVAPSASEGTGQEFYDRFYLHVSGGNAGKLQWFTKIEKEISDFAASNPGFTEWFTRTFITLINSMAVEKKRVNAASGVSISVPQVSDLELKYQQAEKLLIQLWMEEYPKQTTNAARLLWFKKLEAGILATEKVAPGFGAWLLKTNKPLLDKMFTEKKKASAEVVGPADLKLAAWKVASVATLDYWTKVYPGQTDVMKAKGLVAIVEATQKTEKAAPGYMKWFDVTYPGVSAKMIAEGDRLKNVAVPGSTATGEKPPVEANAQASKATIDAYNALVAGWAQYQKLTTEAQRKAVMTAVWAASVTPQGKIVWTYARSVNPNFVAAVTAEIERLTTMPSAAGKFKPATSAAPAGGGVGARTVPSGGGVGARTAPVSAATISVYNQIVSGWAAYPKLAESQRKAWLKTVYSIITTPAGQVAWAYANTVNPSLVSAISTEMARPATPAKSSGGMSLGDAKNKAAPKGAPPRAGVNKKLAGLEEVNDYVTRAKQLRDAARILHADAAQHANVNMRLHRAMGR